MRALAAALVALLAAGCGGTQGDPAELGPEAVRAAPARAHAEGTVEFQVLYTRTKGGGRAQPYLSGTGALDLARGSGRLGLDLSGLAAGVPATVDVSPFDEPFELRWDARLLKVRAEDLSRRIARDEARESAGLLGRLPDEPAAMLGLLALAEDTRVTGADEIHGRPTRRFAFRVPSLRAGKAGVPAELAPALRQGHHGPVLDVETWLDADGLPRRIALRIPLPAVTNASGAVLLPARTITGTYDYLEYGGDVDTGPD